MNQIGIQFESLKVGDLVIHNTGTKLKILKIYENIVATCERVDEKEEHSMNGWRKPRAIVLIENLKKG